VAAILDSYFDYMLVVSKSICLNVVRIQGSLGPNVTLMVLIICDYKTALYKGTNTTLLLYFAIINPLTPSVIMWLHLECSAPYRPNTPFLISDVQELWRLGLNARVPEYQKLKKVG